MHICRPGDKESQRSHWLRWGARNPDLVADGLHAYFTPPDTDSLTSRAPSQAGSAMSRFRIPPPEQVTPDTAASPSGSRA